LSVGRFQDVRKQVNLENLRQLGIDLVRRQTGGRAQPGDFRETLARFDT